MIITKSRKLVYIILISLITFVIYYPGLFGDYVFDDMPNIVENQKLRIEHLNKNEILSAFWSGDAGPLGRPISMLSFAFNYYFTGLDPFYFKLTNIFIHIINSILVYFVSYKIFKRLFISTCNNKIFLMAGIVSLVWAIHPLNLTSVLYIVQRMTSLSALFGFLAILSYCCWREIKNIYSLSSVLTLFFIGTCLILSVYTKESGALFIPLIYWIELLIFNGRDRNNKEIYLSLIHI